VFILRWMEILPRAAKLLLPQPATVQSQKCCEVEDTVQEQRPMQLTGHTLHVELGADKLIRALPVIEGVRWGPSVRR
jgi:hypothetical protein